LFVVDALGKVYRRVVGFISRATRDPQCFCDPVADAQLGDTR
jgi:hypothetical protein